MKKLLCVVGLLSVSIVALAHSGLSPIQYAQGKPVFSSPYLGERSKFEAFDLMVNIPKQSQSLRLLEQLANAETELAIRGYTLPEQPTVDLSGGLSVLGQSNNAYNNDKVRTNIDLASVELDIFSRVNKWSLLFFDIKYDTTPASTSLPAGSNKVNYSRFYLEQAFVTFGNLNELPVYMTAGQIMIPFGVNSSNLVSGALTSSMNSVLQRVLMLGVTQKFNIVSYDMAIYGFNSSWNAEHYEGGAKLGLAFAKEHTTVKVNLGVISNILEAKKFTTTFAGNQSIKSRQVGYSAQVSFAYGPVSVSSELVMFACKMNKDLVIGAEDSRLQPIIVHSECSLELAEFYVPIIATIGYSVTTDSYAFDLPQSKIAFGLTAQLLKSTLLGIEFANEFDYPKSKQARVLGTAPKTGTAGRQSSFKIFLGYYF